MEYLKLGLMVLGVFTGLITLFHTIVLVPMKERILRAELREMSNSENIQHLQIDHAKLSTTLESLTFAINRLTDKFDNSNNPR